GSPRRRAQLLAARPDLEVVDIRGNVDTRLAMVTDGELDGVVLAMAGLSRIGREEHVAETFEWPTAPAPGALAAEGRAADPRAGAGRARGPGARRPRGDRRARRRRARRAHPPRGDDRARLPRRARGRLRRAGGRDGDRAVPAGEPAGGGLQPRRPAPPRQPGGRQARRPRGDRRARGPRAPRRRDPGLVGVTVLLVPRGGTWGAAAAAAAADLGLTPWVLPL